MRAFSPEVIKKLRHYVYLYLDPHTAEVFYVGKGKANCAFAHLEDRAESEKTKRIQEIRSRGREPQIEILIHGLSDEHSAYRVEASVIDLLGKDQVTNVVRGWRSGTYGRMPVEQIEALYAAKEAVITEPSLLIRINRLFRYGMTAVELYDATRGTWVIGEKRKQVELAMAVFEGVVQEVHQAVHSPGTEDSGFPDTGRRRLLGTVRRIDRFRNDSHQGRGNQTAEHSVLRIL